MAKLVGRRARRAALLAVGAAALAAPPAEAQLNFDFVDWTGASSGVQHGTLPGNTVTLAGPVHSAIYDGSFPLWNRSFFLPPLERSDHLELFSVRGSAFTLSFASAVTDPILHIGSLASTIAFASGTRVTKLSGQDTFVVAGSSVSGTVSERDADGNSDANGTIRLHGTFTQLTFTAVPTFLDGTRPDGILLQLGVAPPPPPPRPTPTAPPQPTPVTPPPPIPAPQVTALEPSGVAAAGSPLLMAAILDRAAERIDWDLTGDGRFDTSCPGDQPYLSFRPTTSVVSARAVSDAGIGPRFTRTLALRPSPAVTGTAHAVAIAAMKWPTVVCTTSSNWSPGVSPVSPGRRVDAPSFCLASTVHMGPLAVTGCMKAVTTLAQVPSAERSQVKALLNSKYGVPAGAEDAAIGLTDTVIARGSAIVNGVTLTPDDGAAIVLSRPLSSILSANARLSVGAIRLGARRDFRIDIAGAGNRLSLGRFPRLSGPSLLGGLGLDGDIGVELVGGENLEHHAQLLTHLVLPSWLGGFKAAATVRVARNGVIQLDSASIGPITFGVPPIGIQDLKIDYRQGAWYGQLKLCVTPSVCIDATPELGGVQIGPGDYFSVAASVPFGDPGLPLFSGVYLNRISAGVSHPPLRLLGGARVTVAKLVEIDGGLAIAFASPSAPYRLETDRATLGNSFPPADYRRDLTGFTLAAGADAFLRVPAFGRLRLGGAHFLYTANPGYIALGGGINADFFGVIHLNGGVSAQVNLDTGRFNLHGRLDACLADIPILDGLCWGAVANVSTVGVGGCVEVGPLNVGGGVRYSPFEVFLWPFDGCRWSRFRDDNVARAAQTSGRVIQTRSGSPSRAIELRGTDGAPRVRVTTSDGSTLDSTDGAGLARNPRIRILRSERLKLTVVGLVDPAPGEHRIELLPGSVAIAASAQASDQPPARISARVTGRGTTRTLVYDIGERDDQKVRFFEVRAGGSREIATTTWARGRLRFTPGPGHGPSKIEARFELAGVGAETRTVARFTPPSPLLPRPRLIRADHHVRALRVAWTPVADATGYDLRVQLATGGERRIQTTKTATLIRGIPRHSAGHITVRATAPARRSTAGTARFPAAGPRPATRIQAPARNQR